MTDLGFVSDFKPLKSIWKVRVKIVRIWKQYSSAGDKIRATVKKEQVSQFDPFLRQGLSKLMVNFSVMHSGGSYRTTNHPYRIVFLATTRVRVCEDLQLVLTGLNPMPFKDIMDGTLDPNYLVDVIGQIVEVTNLEVVTVDGDERLPIDLLGYPKIYLGLAVVDSNLMVPVNGISEKDDLFIHTPRKSIAEVLASRQWQVEKCIVVCTITETDTNMGCYYMSYKTCSKKVLTVPNDSIDDEIDGNVFDHIYFCVKCNSYNPNLLPRYKLHVVVLDSSSNTKFLLFNNLTTQLLHPLFLSYYSKLFFQIQEPRFLPAAINNLVGKTYLFKIGIERENYLYKQPTFKVLKIITNSEMIYEFDVTHSPTVCTPAKRSGAPVINLEASFDENYVTLTTCPIKIKKEKLDESG
ncbi:hypothetical protein N665_0123s0019 [Sinapis alba]|nr:hypothetical protein N665_0123s0019 [Sinapis alba]